MLLGKVSARNEYILRRKKRVTYLKWLDDMEGELQKEKGKEKEDEEEDEEVNEDHDGQRERTRRQELERSLKVIGLISE